MNNNIDRGFGCGCGCHGNSDCSNETMQTNDADYDDGRMMIMTTMTRTHAVITVTRQIKTHYVELEYKF